MLLIVIGAEVIVGWLLKSLAMVTLVPGGVPMAFNTAIAFVVLGCALFGLRSGRKRWVGGCGVLLGLLGIASILRFFLGWRIGYDEFVLVQRLRIDFSGAPRMAPTTGMSLVICGAALLLLSSRRL